MSAPGTSGTLSFHKLPSGGRGEYELVGRQGTVVARDLENRLFTLDTPFGRKETGVYLGNQGAKRRLRLADTRTGIHIQRQLAALLLLPQSTRSESSVSSALPVLLRGRYILDASIDLIAEDLNEAVVRPRTLVARSGDITDESAKLSMSADQRFRDLASLYDKADWLPTGLASLVRTHQRLILEPGPIGKPVEQTVAQVMESLAVLDVDYLPGGDPLPTLLKMTGLLQTDIDIPAPPMMPADDLEIKRRAEHIYRQRKMRGAAAGKFRLDVQKAYDFRCAFCGLRAPAVKKRSMPGVDAAHILPWGAYDLDIPQNGLILCKQHHWAFDSHVLKLDHVSGSYFVHLADDAVDVVDGDERTLEILVAAVGRITEDRLPTTHLRPNPAFIEELYSATEPTPAS